MNYCSYAEYISDIIIMYLYLLFYERIGNLFGVYYSHWKYRGQAVALFYGICCKQ